MDLPRLSPRARARWATLLGVVAGGSLVSLNRDVLPFTDWPSLRGHGDASQQLPAAPALVRGTPAHPGTPGRVLATVGIVAGAGTAPLAAAPIRATRGAQLEGTSGVGASSAVHDRDSDNDGVPNSVEQSSGSNPRSVDSDADGIPDGWEVQNGLDPTNPQDAVTDTDGDGLTNATEYKAGES